MKAYIGFFYDKYFTVTDPLPADRDINDIKKTLQLVSDSYDPVDEQTVWFDKLKDAAEAVGYARETKLWRKNPQDYKGHVGDVAAFLRIALVGRADSPDLYEVMRILGAQRVRERICKAVSANS